MITSNEIHTRLREAISTSHMTQVELARRLGMHPTSVNKYMKEDVFPSLEVFAAICEILDVSADDILGLK